MRKGSIHITDYDLERLQKLLQLEKIFIPDIEDPQGLEAELNRTQPVASKKHPRMSL